MAPKPTFTTSPYDVGNPGSNSGMLYPSLGRREGGPFRAMRRREAKGLGGGGVSTVQECAQQQPTENAVHGRRGSISNRDRDQSCRNDVVTNAAVH